MIKPRKIANLSKKTSYFLLALLLFFGAREAQATYDFAKLPLLKITLRLLRSQYIDPTQLKARPMLQKALDQWALKVDSLMFELDPQFQSVTVTLKKRQKTFKLETFFDLFDVWIALQPIASFVKKYYRGPISFSQMESAIISGALSTLDKQTTLTISSNMSFSNFIPKKIHGRIGAILTFYKKKLIIIKVLPDSPAFLCGMKKGDWLLRIQNEKVTPKKKISYWLRKIIGLRGTRVVIHYMRQGFLKPKRVVLIRALVKQPNVTSFLLPGQIGYIRLNQFLDDAYLDIREHLGRLRRLNGNSLLGLIFDLRNNPGGQVLQAVSIASLFLDKGEIVTYAGANIKRKTYNVKGTQQEEAYPLIILVNGHSASAAELLAGALQRHNRALIVGRQTYGKGTVQIISSLPSANIIYRMTIAQYMLPGEVSIQAIGIQPDIELHPVKIDKNNIIYYSTRLNDIERRRRRWPRFLQQNLNAQHHAKYSLDYLTKHLPQKYFGYTPYPINFVKNFLFTTKKKRVSPQDWIFQQPPLIDDFEVWFARYLLVHSRSSRRKILLKQISPFIKRIQQHERRRIIKALKKLGIDWRPTSRLHASPNISFQAHILEKLPLRAGEKFTLKLTVKNEGNIPVHRLRILLLTPDDSFSHHEFLFGLIPPHQQRSLQRKFIIPQEKLGRSITFTLKLIAQNLPKSLQKELPLSWKSAFHPRFAIAYQILDPIPQGNNDGRLQPGEHAFLRLTLENRSRHPTTSTHVYFQLKNNLIRQKLRPLKSFAPQQRKSFLFPLHIDDKAKFGPASLKLTLVDLQTQINFHHTFPLKILPPFIGKMKSLSQNITLQHATPLYQAPDLKSHQIALASQGIRLKILRQFLSFFQVQLPQKLFGTFLQTPPHPNVAWIPQKKGTTTHSPPTKRIPQILWDFEPPEFIIKNKELPLKSSQQKFQLTFTLRSKNPIEELYVIAGKRKVFYRALQWQTLRHPKTLTFHVWLSLRRGAHPVSIVASTPQGRFYRRLMISYVPRKTNRITQRR